MKNIYIHIGHFKTGTSAIQKYLFSNKKRHRSLGYHYLDSLSPRGNVTTHGKLSGSLFEKFGGRMPKWYTETESFEDNVKKALNELEKASADNFIISSEEFIRLGLMAGGKAQEAIALLRNAFKDYNIVIVYYIREPFSLLRSWYNQCNKGNGKWIPRTFIEFFYTINAKFLSQIEIYDLWAREFGTSNVIVKRYSHKDPGAFISEFLRAIGLNEVVGDDALIENLKIDDKILESRRIDRIIRTAANKEEYFQSKSMAKDQNFTRLKTKISKINSQFEKFCQLNGIEEKSQLSLHNIISHGNYINAIPHAFLTDLKDDYILKNINLIVRNYGFKKARYLIKAAYAENRVDVAVGNKLKEIRIKLFKHKIKNIAKKIGFIRLKPSLIHGMLKP